MMRHLTPSFFRHRIALICALGGLCSLGAHAAAAAAPAVALKPEALTVAFTPSAFLNVNRNDIEAGYILLAQIVGRQRGYLVQSKVHYFETARDFDLLLRDASTRMIIVNSSRYLTIEDRAIVPCFVTSERGQVGKQYLLLTRQGGGLNSLADLRGKEILVYEVANTTLGRFWLETLLLEEQSGAAGDYFARVDGVGKPSSAVLPVFFGRKQACVVDRAAFELMKELNPQVGKALQVIATSEPLLDSLLCLRTSDWGPGTFRDDLMQTLADLHREPAGAQLLTLFKTDQLVPFEAKQLATIRKLRAIHDRWRKEATP